MAMDPAIKLKWVQALNSNRYYQGKGAMYDADTNCFCAIGLLAEVCGIEFFAGHFVFYEDDCQEANGYLPESFCRRVGLPRSEMFNISRMNDEGKTFPEIANYIHHTL